MFYDAGIFQSFVLHSHAKEGSLQGMGFSLSNRIGAPLIASQPDLAQGAAVLTGNRRTSLKRSLETE